jgi:hypothetical protein
MEPTSLPTELILNHPRQRLGSLYLEGTPQPGALISHAGQLYTVLERCHRYQFRANRYHLHKIALYVQKVHLSEEHSWVNEGWVIGEATCRYNARSPLLRCAINPAGPCRDCTHYAPLDT